MTIRKRVRLVNPPLPWLLLLLFALALLIPFLDATTGPDLRFSILMVLPVALAAWSGWRTLALSTALLLPLTRIGFEQLVWHNTPLAVSVLNTTIRFVVLVVIALITFGLGKRSRELREQFGAVVDATADAVIRVGRDGRITYWNARAKQLFDYPVKMLLGQPLTRIAAPEGQTALADTIKRVLHAEQMITTETVLLSTDGTPIMVSVSFVPLRDDSGGSNGAIGIIHDIRERTQAEAHLHAQMQLLYRISERFPRAYVSVVNRDFVIDFAAGQAFAQRNLSPNVIVGMSIGAIFGRFGEDTLHTITERYGRTFSGDAQSFELIVDGEYQQYDAVPLPHADGTISQILVVVQDITERRLSEQRQAFLLHLSDALRPLGDPKAVQEAVTTTAMHSFDADRCFYCEIEDGNAVIRRDATRGDLPSVVGVYPLNSMPILEAIIAAGKPFAIEDMTLSDQLDVYAQQLCAELQIVSFIAIPVIKHSQPVGIMCVTQCRPRVWTTLEIDLASETAERAWSAVERAKAEEALRTSEQRLRLAQQVARMGTFDADFQNDKNIWTPELEALHGLAPGTFAGTRAAWEELVHPDDLSEILAYIQNALETQASADGEWRVIWPDGSIHWVAGRFQVVNDASGMPRRLMGVNMDITAQKHAEAEQRQFETRMHQTQRLESLGVLAGGIAHDFNNLLMVMIGHADLALEELPAHSPAYASITASINTAHRAAELTAQMLAYAGRSSFSIASLDLSTLVTDMRPLLAAAVSKLCVLQYNLAPALPPVAADSTQLRQVLMNLVINASEAMEHQGGTITLTTGVGMFDRANLAPSYLDAPLPEGQYVFVTVADQGAGMDAETQTHMFEPFFTTKFTGRGLGLAAALGIIRGHGGTLTVQSTPNTGTTMTVLLPTTTWITDSTHEAPQPEPFWRTSGTVLVVDDEDEVRAVARLMLEQFGFTVLTAADGQAGVDMFSRYAPEVRLVLLDMTMPRLDGAVIFQELRAVRDDVPVVVMSGYSETQVLSAFAEQPPAAFVQKPLALSDLRALVRQIVDR